MASTRICSSCLKVLRVQLRKELLQPSSKHIIRSSPNGFSAYRAFATSRLARAEDRSPERPPLPPHSRDKEPTASEDRLKAFAASVRQREALKSTTEPYVAYGSTETLFAECSRQLSYTVPAVLKNPPEPTPRNAAGEDIGEGDGWWLRSRENGGLGLDVTFNTWAQVMFLYMYMLTVRLRCFPEKHARIWHQQLVDHFFYAAEDRMVTYHNLSSRSIRNRYLKDLAQQWRGLLLSYDEGLIKGDAVLAAAIWRNVFKAREDVEIRDLAMVTAYMRSQLKMLDELSDQTLGEGKVEFDDPELVKGLVGQESAWMSKVFAPEEEGEAENPTTRHV